MGDVIVPTVEKLKQMIICYEIIGVTWSETSVPAGTVVYVDIQPPAGETWLVDFCVMNELGATGQDVAFYDYDGTTRRVHALSRADSIDYYPHLTGIKRILTNTLYASCRANNKLGYSVRLWVSYSGFKIKSSSLRFAELINSHNPPGRPFKRAKLFTDLVPDALQYEIYDEISRKYVDTIILPENIPQVTDAKGNVIQRYSQYCFFDSFNSLFGDLIADTTKRPLMDYIRERSVTNKMGWEKYIDKWKAEGIEF